MARPTSLGRRVTRLAGLKALAAAVWAQGLPPGAAFDLWEAEKS